MTNKYIDEINSIIERTKKAKQFRHLTVSEWFSIFITDYCQNIKSSTLASYKQSISNHIDVILGNILLDDLCSEVIQYFIKILSVGDEECNRSPLSAKSVKNVYGVLHKGLSCAHKMGYMNADVNDMVIMLPKTLRHEIVPLSNDEISALLVEIAGSQYESLIITALFTGMRQSELLGLKWQDVDFSSGTITISHQLSRDKITHKYIITSVKNDKPRTLSPAPFVMQRLERDFKGERNEFVFQNEFGLHFSHNAVYRYLRKAANKAFGRSDVRFHDLRHTYAVLALQAGDDYKTLQANMGHYSAAFTLDRYGHCTDTMKKMSSQRMEGYYNTFFGIEKGDNYEK